MCPQKTWAGVVIHTTYYLVPGGQQRPLHTHNEETVPHFSLLRESEKNRWRSNRVLFSCLCLDPARLLSGFILCSRSRGKKKTSRARSTWRPHHQAHVLHHNTARTSYELVVQVCMYIAPNLPHSVFIFRCVRCTTATASPAFCLCAGAPLTLVFVCY